jgi:hypothetical protein
VFDDAINEEISPSCLLIFSWHALARIFHRGRQVLRGEELRT